MKNTLRNLSKETLREYIENWTYCVYDSDYSSIDTVFDLLFNVENRYSEFNNEEIISYEEDEECNVITIKTRSNTYVFNCEDDLLGYNVAMGSYKEGFINTIILKDNEIIGLLSIKLLDNEVDIFKNQLECIDIKSRLDKFVLEQYDREEDLIENIVSICRDEWGEFYIEFEDYTLIVTKRDVECIAEEYLRSNLSIADVFAISDEYEFDRLITEVDEVVDTYRDLQSLLNNEINIVHMIEE